MILDENTGHPDTINRRAPRTQTQHDKHKRKRLEKRIKRIKAASQARGEEACFRGGMRCLDSAASRSASAFLLLLPLLSQPVQG